MPSMMNFARLSVTLALLQGVFALPASPNPAVGPSELFARQNEIVCCFGECGMKIADEPNEEAEYLHMQVTSNIACGADGSCSVSKLNSHTVGWTIQAGVNTPWSSAGVGWTSTVTTG